MCCIIKYRLPFGVFKIIVKHIFSCGLLCFFRKICLHMLIIKGWIAILEKSLKRTIAKSQWCLESQQETWIPMAWWHDGALVASWRPGDVGATINGDLLEIYWISNTQGNKIMEIDVASFPVQNHPISCHSMPPIYGGCASQFLTLQTSNTGRFSEFLALTIINYLTYTMPGSNSPSIFDGEILADVEYA